MTRIIAALALVVMLQPVAAHADWMDDIAGPGCVRAGNEATLWRCTEASAKAELAGMNINGGYPMGNDKPAPKHHRGRSKPVADR